MALKNNWIDKIDGVSPQSSKDVNQLARAIIELEDAFQNFSFDIDSAMSDDSENAVQNKVIKKYVDDSVANKTIEVDTEMSTVSENPVQNKVVKKYIDDIVGDIDDVLNNIITHQQQIIEEQENLIGGENV
jgi:hypothetical protein